MNGSVSVRQLNLYVKSLLDGDARLSGVAVTGEISNFKNHYASGHWYFTLKDSDASIRCVMFRSSAARVRFSVSDGMQVTVRGRVSIYEKDGQYQLYAEEMTAGGAGDIARAFEAVKQKLLAEGLFAEENKRPLPEFARQIAVVTSATGAAVQDILNILGRRYPLCNVLLCPVAVQGESAVPEMLDALERIYALGTADLIIIGRGGGSAEDLWAFNSEELARKIYESPVPVISAVGHETDFTICDFVADLRAPTPSAAAELAVPERYELLRKIAKCESVMASALKNRYTVGASRLHAAMASPVFRQPECLVSDRMQQVDRLCDRMTEVVGRKAERSRAELARLAAGLDALSPLKVLSRGYSVVQKDNHVVKSSAGLCTGDRIHLTLSDGSADCTVEGVAYDGKNEL